VTPATALALIQQSVATEQYEATAHFQQRMAERGLFWGDVLAVIEEPDKITADGDDDYGRPKFKLAGETLGGLDVEIVAALDYDEQGNATVFITLYWAD